LRVLGDFCLRSYIKVYGPPVLEAIRALEKIAVGMPEVCIMDTVIVKGVPQNLAQDIGGYFSAQGVAVPVERCRSILSDARGSLGEYDFFFEWRVSPSVEQFHGLIDEVDGALATLGCYYTVTTKPR
jgi:hypothetical protein